MAKEESIGGSIPSFFKKIGFAATWVEAASQLACRAKPALDRPDFWQIIAPSTFTHLAEMVDNCGGNCKRSRMDLGGRVRGKLLEIELALNRVAEAKYPVERLLQLTNSDDKGSTKRNCEAT
jgi:hypothetical protein